MSSPVLYTPTILIDTVIEAVAAFLQPFVGSGTPITRAQVNRVAPPKTAGNVDPLAFVELRELSQRDLETPTMIQNPDKTLQFATITTPTALMIQIDFYGLPAGDWCKAVKAVVRSPYATQQFPPGIAPLFCDDGRQMPLVTGEEQYENRFALTMTLQYNPDVIVPSQSALIVTMNVFEDLP